MLRKRKYTDRFVSDFLQEMKGIVLITHKVVLQEDRVELSWMDNIRLMIIGVLGVGVAQMVVFIANKLVGAGIIGVLVPLSVVITALISGVMGLESLGLIKVTFNPG